MILERLGRLALADDLDIKDQLAAAKIYLSKTMPDLKATELSGEVDVNAQSFIFHKRNRG